MDKPSPTHVIAPLIDCRTLFLSDIHLGTADSKASELIRLLKRTHCEKIVLVGDIIDMWALNRGGKWTHKHTRLIRLLLKKMDKEGCELIYIRGNHDDFLTQVLPFNLGGLHVVSEYVHTGKNGKHYLVLHGDGFDSIATNHKWLAVLGSISYDLLLAVNRYYNAYRSWRGKEYFSISKAIKAKVKSAVSFVGRYEEQLKLLTEHKKCSGIICGHIHAPADKMIDSIHYLNCGDWVESLSFVAENHDGSFEVGHYADYKDRLKVTLLPDKV